MLYRYILALTLTAMCTVNGVETTTTTTTSSPSKSPTALPTASPTVPTSAPTTTESVYWTTTTVTIPCCGDSAVTPTALLADDMCPDSTVDAPISACDVAKFTADTTFHHKDAEVTGDTSKDGTTCNCVYTLKRFEYTLTAQTDDYADREQVAADRWPNLVGYAEWSSGEEKEVTLEELDCHSMFVTACPASQECTGYAADGDNTEQLPESMDIAGDGTMSRLSDWAKSHESWPTAEENVRGGVCYCFWLYSSCPTSAPTAAPTVGQVMADMTTTDMEDNAAKHSLIATVAVLCLSFVFTLF